MTADSDLVSAAQGASELEGRVLALQDQMAAATHILTATHHEMNREVTMVGFAIDDLSDAIEASEASEDLDLSEILSAYARLEEGRDHVAALAALGTAARTDVSQTVTADELVVLTNTDMAVRARCVQPLVGVNRLLMRALVKNAARNAESHGRAREFSITTDGHRLELADDGLGCTQQEIDDAFRVGTRANGDGAGAGLSLMRRVAEAHGAAIHFIAGPGSGVRVTIDVPGQQVDLRNSEEPSRRVALR